MIEIKELDMHLEDNTLVHNTKGHEKREGHRWKEERAAYEEELFEYVWKVADHFMPAHVEPWEEGEELIEHRLVERLTRQTGYRILVTCFDKGNTYPFPEGTPEVCRTIYNDIRQWCHEQEMMCPPYLHECISAIATHYPCTRDELKANMHDEAFMNRYSVLTVLRSRIPNPPQKVESLQYFVKVLLSKTVDLTPEEEKSFIL